MRTRWDEWLNRPKGKFRRFFCFYLLLPRKVVGSLFGALVWVSYRYSMYPAGIPNRHDLSRGVLIPGVPEIVLLVKKTADASFPGTLVASMLPLASLSLVRNKPYRIWIFHNRMT